jgi:hypothetical protein
MFADVSKKYDALLSKVLQKKLWRRYVFMGSA